MAPPKPAAPVAGTLAPVPTLAPVATVAPVPPSGVPLKPQLLPVASAGALQFREQGADTKPVAQSGSAAELQGGHERRSISDWLVVGASEWFSEMAVEKKSPQIESGNIMIMDDIGMNIQNHPPI